MGMIAIALGAALVWFARFTYQRRQQQLAEARARVGWPTVPGTIIVSTVDELEEETTNADGASETTTQYAPRIAYEYVAFGHTQTGTRIHVLEDAPCATRGGAQAICERYPIGATVAVHVGPLPTDGAYLDGDIREGRERVGAIALAVILGGAGLVLLAVGLAQLLASEV